MARPRKSANGELVRRVTVSLSQEGYNRLEMLRGEETRSDCMDRCVKLVHTWWLARKELSGQEKG